MSGISGGDYGLFGRTGNPLTGNGAIVPDFSKKAPPHILSSAVMKAIHMPPSSSPVRTMVTTATIPTPASPDTDKASAAPAATKLPSWLIGAAIAIAVAGGGFLLLKKMGKI